jgi:acetyltransferase-like isoleucine patch superfamily enzyme
MKERELGEITGGWDYSELPENVWIGEHCWLERKTSFARFRSTRDPGLVLGDRVRVYTWSTFNVEPAGRVDVGNDAVLVGATFMCANHISIGERVILSYQVTIADADFHPLDPHARKQDAMASAPQGDLSQRPGYVCRPVRLDDDVWVGIGAIILKGVHIGRGARIGPGAVVTRDVPAGAHVEGNPATVIEDEDWP